MSDLKLPAVVPIKRVYPHVDEIADGAAQQSQKLAWDRIHSLEERLQAQETNAQLLADAHNVALAQIAVAQTTAASAMAIAQQPTVGAASLDPHGTSGVGVGGPGGGGPNAGDPGSQTNPIIAMSIDPAAIAASVRASLQFFGMGFGPADQYWIDKASVPGQFSNGKWYQGWNAYWEARADPHNTGSADPNLGSQPSVHQ
jgi:hypothetical protein